MAEKTYYDWLFEESEEEKEIQRKLDEEREHYEATEAYKEHKAKLDGLFDELKEAGEHRRKEAEKHKPKRVRMEMKTEEEMAELRKKNQEERQKKIDALPEKLKGAINAYQEFDAVERKTFRNYTRVWVPDYDDYKDPITTEKDLKELLEILVQTTIDFINERGLTDIDAIGFGADGLQPSVMVGEWTCSTDANIHATGLGKEKSKDGREYTVVQKIGEYM